MRLIRVPFFILLAVAQSSFGAFLPRVSGNTRPHLVDGIGGTVNFAVLDQNYAEVGDSWGTGNVQFNGAFRQGFDEDGRISPALDRRAKYIYLYQVVNDGAKGVPIQKNSVKLLVDPGYLTSWGYFEGLGFADDKDGDGKLEPASAVNTFGPPAQPGTPSGMSIGVRTAAIVSIGEGEDKGMAPESVWLLPKVVYAKWPKEAPLLKGQRGVIYGFTTDLPPTTDQTLLHPQPPPPPRP